MSNHTRGLRGPSSLEWLRAEGQNKAAKWFILLSSVNRRIINKISYIFSW